jgi:hypothetical protein
MKTLTVLEGDNSFALGVYEFLVAGVVEVGLGSLYRISLAGA